ALRVEGRTGADEIGMLNRAFNRMTAQIEAQTTDLIKANSQLDQRRVFMETLLESTSAGIVSIDIDENIELMNNTAQTLLLGTMGQDRIGSSLAVVAPQIAQMIKIDVASDIVSHSKDGELLTLAVKIATTANGRVITFEDITRQVIDQRQAAWSDVARRIAHEIKNPLTPIQLATERLKRRYRKQITTDTDLFDDLTDTIVRQVGDLRKMVDEFSSFARLPKPVFRTEDALDLVRQSIFLQDVAHPEITFAFSPQCAPRQMMSCDRHQIGQALTNILKNAVEAIETKAGKTDGDYQGEVDITFDASPDTICIAVIDNGIGLPQDRDQIVEPYVTTRAKGTGLGLAIVTKIVEEHGGEMHFASTDRGGTKVTIELPRDPLTPQMGAHS
ncbi:MAG: ATP-binding protein, partial [Pontixanthobacter sp.]